MTFFIGSIASWLLSCKLFAHGVLEIIGQAETDDFFFFKKNLKKVSLLYIFFPEIKVCQAAYPGSN